ncbi:RHS repeat-associated core domain-containing protein [Flavitalea flava]
MSIKKIKRVIFVFIIIQLVFGRIQAQFEEGQVSRQLNSISCNQAFPSVPNTVSYTSLGEASRKIKNILRFKFNELQPTGSPGSPLLFFNSGFLATATLKVELWELASSAGNNPDLIMTPVLSVNYDPTPGSKYNPVMYMELSGTTSYELVRVTINNIVYTNMSNGWTEANVKPLLTLENEMQILRYFPLSNTPSQLAPTGLTGSYDGINHSDQLSLSWNFPAGSNNNISQLEYAWVENETKGFYNINGVFDANTLFRTNSTRIDIDYNGSNYNYNVPLLLPADPGNGGGTLYYRVRAALRKNDGSLISGSWSSPQTFSNNGHQPNMNWQSSTIFAENGKSKTVIQYFDGTLRGRQTVTKDNNTGNTTVAETIYDLQGRPNVQILPTPTLSTAIQYFSDFNRFSNQTTNDNPVKYFDLSVAGTQCQGSPKLDITRGNGQYYSANNPWKGVESSANLIPDANGYGYTETRYTDDPTARVSRQGGVGQAQQIGNGHETKLYYGKPTQNELDALFGTEAGDATHYFKNMVQDANGQMSISYIDMHGRTVATSLAGNSPLNLSTINNNPSFYPVSSGQLTNNFLTPASNIIKNNSIESISTILLPYNTPYNFTYQLNPAIFQQFDCNNHQVCFDCKYDLEISIRQEDCNGALPIVKHFNNLQMVPANQACGTPMGFTGDGINTPTNQINFQIPLTTGSWVVRKTLTINDSLFRLREDSAMKVFLCRTQKNIQDSVFAVLSTASNCGTPAAARNCTTCQAQLGTYSTYKANYLIALGGSSTLTDDAIHALFAQDSLDCADACGISLHPALGTLTQIRAQMLNDMNPYAGQYAIAPSMVNGSNLEAKYNIFTTSYAGSPGIKPYYKNPVSEPSGAATFYATADGTIDYSVYPNGDPTDKSVLNGLSTDGFTSMYARNWAAQLIYYHPEYSKLHFAETTLKSSYTWLDNVMQCNTYADALAKGYLNPLSSDPYFTFNSNQGYVSSDRTNMSNYLTVSINPNSTVGYTIWLLANGIALGDTTQPVSMRAYYTGTMNKTGIDPSATTTIQKDAVWQAFRSQYLNYRNEMVLSYINAQQAGILSAAAMSELQTEGKQLRFANGKSLSSQWNWTWWDKATNLNAGDSVGLATLANTYVAANSTDHCIAQRPFWQSRLMQCEQLQQFLLNQTHSDSVKVTNIINLILDSLVMVCHNSVDNNNPSGASNVNPVKLPVAPSNFEDIINHVFALNGIVTLPGNFYFCNPYSVDYPKPYNSNPPVFVNQRATVDTCNCRQWTLLKGAAKTAGFDTTSLGSMNIFLAVNYNDTISLPLWQGLLQCNTFNWNSVACFPRQGGGGGGAALTKPSGNTGISKLSGDSAQLKSSLQAKVSPSGGATPQFSNDSCVTYYKPIILGSTVVIPPFLNCGYVQPCLSCASLQNYTIAFRLFYPTYAGVPYISGVSVDTGMAKQNALWARYLNFKTGFNKTANEYAAAYLSCNLSAPVTDLDLTDRNAQPPSGSTLPLLYTASNSVTFDQGYISFPMDNFETLISAFPGLSGTALCALDKPLTYIALPDTTQFNPCQQVQEQANFIGLLLFQQRSDFLKANFDSLYKAQCLSVQATEIFYATYQPSEYHYTLYYYDQAGNLLKTLSPAAVKPNYGSTYLVQVQNARASSTDLANSTNIENMAVQYRYNSLNQVIAQRTPDAGSSYFWYDRLARLAVSQNARQVIDPSYSYTLYDQLGRITEVGQKPQTTVMTQGISQDTTALKNWLSDLTNGGIKQQITRTVYDQSYPGFATAIPLSQLNLRNRVSYTQVIDLDNTNLVPYRAATFYSYDIHGNVDTLLQDYGNTSVMNAYANRFKLIKYDYDLVSGKVNQVSYQPGKADAFYHQYSYDAENRLIGVRTSQDSIQWQNDAAYQYYRHGPLARVQLGDLQVQGVDYAYTLQGWLKSINPSWVNDPSTNDLYDTDGTGTTPLFERDAYKVNLNYFDDGTYSDYKPLSPPTGYIQGNGLPTAQKTNLYNGNIGSMAVNIRKLAASSANAYAGPMIYNYKYDQLNRLTSMDAWAANGSFGPTSTTPMSDFAERFSYDPNGNILTLNRNGTTGTGLSLAMDNLSYQYLYVKTGGSTGEYIPGQAPATGVDHLTNQLSSIRDAVPGIGYDDIKNQTGPNYKYDAIGNMVADSQARVTNIAWSVYGKILSMANDSGTITYTYDAGGNRISKTVKGITTWYVRDASGNVMSTYVQGDNSRNSGALTQTEAHVYGSSRLAILNLTVNCSNLGLVQNRYLVRGSKLFELSNHLGNVLVTISDKKVQHSSNTSTVDYYNPEVTSANDYYSFGMPMPGRTFSNGTYRYGFNGKENDNEVKGIGDQIDYGMRVYDPRLGRFLSVDPLTFKYPFYTPYQYAGNKPVWKIDVDGLEEPDAEGGIKDKEEILKEEDKEEEQAKIRNSLKGPTAEEEVARKKGIEEWLRKSPEDRAKEGVGSFFRNLRNGFMNYGQNALNAAQGALTGVSNDPGWKVHEEAVYNDLVKNNPQGQFGKQITLDIYNKDGRMETITIDFLSKLPTSPVYELVDAKFSSVKDLTNTNSKPQYTESQSASYRWLKNNEVAAVIPRGLNAAKAGLVVGQAIKVNPQVKIAVAIPQTAQNAAQYGSRGILYNNY